MMGHTVILATIDSDHDEGLAWRLKGAKHVLGAIIRLPRCTAGNSSMSHQA